LGKHPSCLALCPLTRARKSNNADVKIITGVAKNMLNNKKNTMAIVFILWMGEMHANTIASQKIPPFLGMGGQRLDRK
jgi:hypothetical protein